MPGRSVTVLIPVNEATSPGLNTCLLHLFDALAEPCGVYVVHAATPDNSVRRTCELWGHQHGFKYLQHAETANIAELCRWAYESIPINSSDVLILNPNAAIGSNALKEMTAVLELHERHAVVVPRSNQPGIPAIPLTGPELSPERSYQIWQSLHRSLPLYQIVSFAAAFCMLIRREVLEHFGLFASGLTERAYSERINRYGYSTVLVNRAFVPVAAGLPQSTGTDDLLAYFEFEADPVDYFASLEISHRPRILVDLYHLAPHYYGTAEFALNLLRDLRQLAGDIEFYLDIQPASFDFFRPELQGYRLYSDELQPQFLFDLVFKPTQINSWEELARINRLAPRVAYTVLDMIAVRCSYLSAPGRTVLFRTAATLCDCVFTLSHSAGADFSALTGSDVSLTVIHPGTYYGVSTHELIEGAYILLIGNAYTHKGLREALAALAGETFPIVVLGGSTPGLEPTANVHYLESGGLSRAIIRGTLAGARVLVYPSHYEGFGLPVLDALALQKQVIVLDNDTNRELKRLTNSDCLQLISSMRNLREAIRNALKDSKPACSTTPRSWHSAAQDYLAAFRAMLDKGIDHERLRARWNFIRAQRA